MAAFVVVGSGLVDRSGEWPRDKRPLAGGSGGRNSGRGSAVAGVSVGSQPRALHAGRSRPRACGRSVGVRWLRPKSRRRSGPQPGLSATASIPACRGRRLRASMAMIRIGNSSETAARARGGPAACEDARQPSVVGPTRPTARLTSGRELAAPAVRRREPGAASAIEMRIAAGGSTRRIRLGSVETRREPKNRHARIAVTAFSPAGWYPGIPISANLMELGGSVYATSSSSIGQVEIRAPTVEVAR